MLFSTVFSASEGPSNTNNERLAASLTTGVGEPSVFLCPSEGATMVDGRNYL